jgi:hypothetical protein
MAETRQLRNLTIHFLGDNAAQLKSMTAFWKLSPTASTSSDVAGGRLARWHRGR